MSLRSVVDLYRAASRPAISLDGSFSARLAFSTAIPFIRDAVDSKKGRFESISVDGVEQDVDDASKLPVTGSFVEFTFKQVTNSSSTFHKDLGALLKHANKISRGECPTDFYIVDINYYDDDVGGAPGEIIALKTICALIKGLQSLALYHDENSTPRLVFVAPSESKVSHVVVEPKITADLLAKIQIQPDTRVIDDLTSTQGEGDPHRSAKAGVFGVTITEVLSAKSETDRFDYLVTHWAEFIERYQKNLSTYLSGFAFHKAKREVAKAEFDIADQYSKLMGDLASKLFGIPISFAVVVTMPKASSALEAILIVISLLLVALIMVGTISTQQDQLKRISHAKLVVLGAFEGHKDLYPDDLKISLLQMTVALAGNEKKLKRNLKFFRALGWVPAIAGSILIVAFWFEPKFYTDIASRLIANASASISKAMKHEVPVQPTPPTKSVTPTPSRSTKPPVSMSASPSPK